MLQEENKNINEKFLSACISGEIGIVKSLLENKNLKEKADIHYRNDDAFTGACENGHIEIVKYLLTSKDITDHIDIATYDNIGFIVACENNHINLVKFLLTSSELEKHANINAYNDYAIIQSSESGHIEIVKYLISFKDKIKREQLCLSFISACKTKEYEIIKYLIYDINLPLNRKIKDFLNNIKDVNINKFLELRTINRKLKSSLKFNFKEDKPIKI